MDLLYLDLDVVNDSVYKVLDHPEIQDAALLAHLPQEFSFCCSDYLFQDGFELFFLAQHHLVWTFCLEVEIESVDFDDHCLVEDVCPGNHQDQFVHLATDEIERQLVIFKGLRSELESSHCQVSCKQGFGELSLVEVLEEVVSILMEHFLDFSRYDVHRILFRNRILDK